MIKNIRELQKSIEELQAALRKIRSKQVYQPKIKGKAKDIVDIYFRNIRGAAAKCINDGSFISGLDSEMQNLLDATHKQTTVTSYKNTTAKLKKSLLGAEKLVLLSSSIPAEKDYIEPIDKKIIGTLKKLNPSAALSYEQAVNDLQAPQRLSWRGPATDFREALRECLDYLAPDKDVTEMPGFKLEQDAKGPTMKQKTTYILGKRNLPKATIKTNQGAVDTVEQTIGSFVRSVYKRANVSTHTPTDKQEVSRIHNLVKSIFCELLAIT